jgi:hypothetical protein
MSALSWNFQKCCKCDAGWMIGCLGLENISLVSFVILGETTYTFDVGWMI